MAALGALLITAPAQASFAPEGAPLAVGAAQPYGVLTADFNRDGRTDAATVNGTGSNLSVFLRGPSGFAAEAGSPFATGPGPGYGVAADFNGDGLPDVATQNFNNGTVSILLRQPGGGFAAGPTLSVGAGTGSVTAADFNGDGRIDIAAPSYTNSNILTYINNGAGFTQEGTNPTGATPRDVAAADFNGDGRPDLAISNLGAGSVTVLLRNPGNTGFASEGAAIPVGASPEGIKAADFNGDGRPDIAVAVLGTNTVNVLLRNAANDGFAAEAPVPVDAGVLGLATADFNADGRPDLAVTSNSAGTVTALLRQAGGGFAADGAPLAAPGANGVATGDFNGDGKPDLAASNDQANTLSVFLNTTAPAAPGPQPTTPPAPPVPGKSVVVRVVSGKVLIKYPPGKAPPGGSTTKFGPLTGAVNVPMGSVIDTTKGRIALTSAADTGGTKTQTADFYDGIFQVKQSVPKKKPKKPAALVTDLNLKGQVSRSQCAPLKGARSATVDKKKGPKSVLGKLWGSGKGKFRTNGKYSSATVRGTIWLVEDRCEGTYTTVRRGIVAVRDFKRKKTVSIKAGHSYLASAATSKSKKR
jgi:FG-GAP-like repeat